MGIWDLASSSMDSLKRNAPDLSSPASSVKNTVQSAISSSADSMKRNGPDLSSVARKSYNYGCSAVWWADNAVRVHGIQRLNHHLQDEEARARAREVATTVAHKAAFYAFREGIKAIPGGNMTYDIVSQSIPRTSKLDMQKEKQASEDLKQKEKMQALEARIAILENEQKLSNSNGPVVGELGAAKRGTKAKPQEDELQLTNDAIQKPEDVLNSFMMENFMGRHLLDALIVPRVRSTKPSSRM